MNLFNLMATISIDNKEYNAKITESEKKTENFSKKTEKNILSLGSTFDKSLNKWIKWGSVGIGTFTSLAVKGGSDLIEVENVVNTVFGSMSGKIESFSKTATEKFGLTELQAKKYSSTLGSVMKSMGLTEEETLKMSTALTGMTGDLASFYNLGHEEAFQKIFSGITGEIEPMKALGVNMSVTNMEAYALSKGINKTWQEMTQAEQAQLRYGYMMDTLSMASGDFAKTLDTSLANQLRVAKNEFMAVAIEIGQKLVPSLTEAVKWFRENWKELIPLATAIAGTVLALKGFMIIQSVVSSIQGVIGAYKAFKLANEGATIAQWLLNVATGAFPVVLIIGAITAVVGALTYFAFNSEEVTKKVKEGWDWLQNKFREFDEWFTGIFSQDWSNSFGFLGDIMNAFSKNISNSWESIKRIFRGIVDFVKGAFSGDWSSAWQGVVNIFGGIMNGLGAVIKAPLNAVIGLVNSAISGLNSISVTIPDFVPIVGGKHFGVNLPKVPYLYNGGIVTQPTFMGGYVAGDSYKGRGNQAEAIIPLDKLVSWINKVAERPVNISIDGREFLRTVAPYQDELTEYSRMTSLSFR